jgi:hypothetical protein
VIQQTRSSKVGGAGVDFPGVPLLGREVAVVWSRLRCRLRWHKWQQMYDKNGRESHRTCRNCGRENIPVPNARRPGVVLPSEIADRVVEQ